MKHANDLILVSTFLSMADAQIAKGVVDAVGIQSLIRSDNAGGMYPALAAVELFVRPEDAEVATATLQRGLR